MQWILRPPDPGDNPGTLGCMIDWCGNFCGVQFCPGRQCPSHVCGVYVSSPTPM